MEEHQEDGPGADPGGRILGFVRKGPRRGRRTASRQRHAAGADAARQGGGSGHWDGGICTSSDADDFSSRSSAPVPDLPRSGRRPRLPAVAQPGAFQVGGGGEGGQPEPDDIQGGGGRVVVGDGARLVEATLVRRKRQGMAVAGLALLAATVAALAVGVPLGLKGPSLAAR
jgi:hypothetical protein